MKRILMVISVLLFSVLAIAQDYAPNCDTCVYYFRSRNDEVLALRSTQSPQGILHYEFQKTWDMSVWNCGLPTGPTWLGKGFYLEGNKWIYANITNTRIHIAPYSQLNKSYIMWQDSTSARVEATLISRKWEELEMGFDTVITFTLKYYNEKGSEDKLEIKKNNLVLSKKYGWIAGYELNEFPLELKPFTLLEISTPNKKSRFDNLEHSIYNFEVGDTFQYTDRLYGFDYDPGRTKYIERAVIGKEIFTDNDSVYYQLSEKIQIKYESHSGDISVESQYDTIYEGYSFAPKKALLPNEANLFFDNNFTNSLLRNRIAYQLDLLSNNKFVFSPNKVILNKNGDDSCYYYVHFDSPIDLSYIEGAGLLERSVFVSQGTNETKLVYYNKQGEKWGERFVFLGVNEVPEILQIPVFPNPLLSGTALQLQLPDNGNFVVKIIDIQGVELLSFYNLKGHTQLEINELNAGVYQLLFEDADGNFAKKKLVVY